MLKLNVQGEERMVPVLSKGEVRHTFTFDASLTPQPKSSLEIVGDLTGWTPQLARKAEDGSFAYEAILRPGNHPYQWVVDGEWILDPANEDRMSNGMGGWNSAVRVTAPVPPKLQAFEKDGKLFFQTDGAAEVLVTVDNMLVHHGAHEDAITLPVMLSGFDADDTTCGLGRPMKEASHRIC